MLQSAAVPDAMVVVEAADAVVVVAGAVVEDGVLAVLFGSEELHPTAISATSAVTTRRPMVVRRIASHPSIPGEQPYLMGVSPENREQGVVQDREAMSGRLRPTSAP